MNTLPYLQNLGLSKNESTVYVELLKLGSTNAGPIVSNTKLHRQLVYEALDKLVGKKLASFVIKNNRKHFQAASPSSILKLIEEKEEMAKQIIPELTRLQTESVDRIEVRTLHGQKGFFDNLKDVVASAKRTDKIMRIIGGGKDLDFYTVVGNRYQEYVDLLQKSKVKKYLIAPTSLSDEFKKKFAKEPGNILKTMDWGLSAPTYTRVTQEMVAIEIYTTNVTIIQIHNKAIAKSYLEHFELLWKQAKLQNK
jgi:sugar-specific transcriptional regulator TrmB